jgi:hypothetical protein
MPFIIGKENAAKARRRSAVGEIFAPLREFDGLGMVSQPGA